MNPQSVASGAFVSPARLNLLAVRDDSPAVAPVPAPAAPAHRSGPFFIPRGWHTSQVVATRVVTPATQRTPLLQRLRALHRPRTPEWLTRFAASRAFVPTLATTATLALAGAVTLGILLEARHTHGTAPVASATKVTARPAAFGPPVRAAASAPAAVVPHETVVIPNDDHVATVVIPRRANTAAGMTLPPPVLSHDIAAPSARQVEPPGAKLRDDRTTVAVVPKPLAPAPMPMLYQAPPDAPAASSSPLKVTTAPAAAKLTLPVVQEPTITVTPAPRAVAAVQKPAARHATAKPHVTLPPPTPIAKAAPAPAVMPAPGNAPTPDVAGGGASYATMPDGSTQLEATAKTAYRVVSIVSNDLALIGFVHAGHELVGPYKVGQTLPDGRKITAIDAATRTVSTSGAPVTAN